MNCAIGIDLGGTNMRAGLVDQDGHILAQTRRKTPVADGPEATAQGMAEMVAEVSRKLPQDSGILGVGIGSPGPLSRSQKKIFQTANLPNFAGFPLGTRVEELTKFEVYLDNDAKCATYGEGLFGVAQGRKNFILMTFGTGVGSGIIVDGKMVYGKTDGACEVGHLTLHPDGLPCGCGNRGCFEKYCSATAIERRGFESLGREVGCVEIFEAQARGDAWAEQLLREVAKDLSLATASLINIFEPEMILFGGGVFATGGGPLCEWVRDGIRDRCFESSRRDLSILPAKLGGEAGMIGAASLVFHSFAGT